MIIDKTNRIDGLRLGSLIRKICYLLISVTLMSSSIALYARVGLMPLIMLCACFICMMICILSIWASNKMDRIFLSRLVGYSLLIYIFLMINWFINRLPASNGTLSFLLILLVGILFIHAIREIGEFEEFINLFITIIILLATISLLLWVLGPIGNFINTNSTIPNTWNGTGEISGYFYGWFNLLYKTQHQYISFLNISIWRNTSIFGEAPAYSLVLNIALASELFLLHHDNKSRKRRVRVFILVAACISTLSTGGIIVSISCLLLHYSFRPAISDNYKIARTALILVLVITTLTVGALLLDSKLSSTSGSIHLDDYIAGFKAWLISPIWGTGLGSNKILVSQMSSFRIDNGGMSNTIAYVLASGGVIYFYIWFRPLIAFVFSRDSNLISFGIISIVLFCSYYFANYIIGVIPLGIGAELAFSKISSRYSPTITIKKLS